MPLLVITFSAVASAEKKQGPAWYNGTVTKAAWTEGKDKYIEVGGEKYIFLPGDRVKITRQYTADDGLRARYAAALQAAILPKWTRPDSVPVGATCRLHIRQLPGGTVMGAEVSSPCSYDEQGRRSIEAAVLKAQPLPYAGFETVFSRDLTLNFRAEDR